MRLMDNHQTGRWMEFSPPAKGNLFLVNLFSYPYSLILFPNHPFGISSPFPFSFA
jgi:hypothetical protein